MLSAFILSVHSYSALHLAAQPIHQRYVRPGPLVLRSCPLNLLTPTTDRDRTVLRRSEPSSRATLIGEQPNPWDLLQPQDVTNRHRGAKPYRAGGIVGAKYLGEVAPRDGSIAGYFTGTVFQYALDPERF